MSPQEKIMPKKLGSEPRLNPLQQLPEDLKAVGAKLKETAKNLLRYHGPERLRTPAKTSARPGAAPVSVTHFERPLLQRLADVGGRYTFRPDGSDQLAYAVFECEVVRILRSLQAKSLVRIDDGKSRLITMSGHTGKYAAIAAELTDVGREALR